MGNFNLIQEHHEQEWKLNDVIEYCNKVLGLNRENVNALFQRGQAYFYTGQVNAALGDFLQALELFPGNANIKNFLLQTLRKVTESGGSISQEVFQRVFQGLMNGIQGNSSRNSFITNLFRDAEPCTKGGLLRNGDKDVEASTSQRLSEARDGNIYRILCKREAIGSKPRGRNKGKSKLQSRICELLSERYTPDCFDYLIDRYEYRAYGGQFSQNGDLYVTTSQDKRIRVYKPQQNRFQLQKEIHVRNMRWTITDTDLSPDERFVVYSSLSSVLNYVDITGNSEIHEAVNPRPEPSYCGFGVLSVKYLRSDGHQVVAGTQNGCIRVYHVERKTLLTKIANAHRRDVNSVCFADVSSRILFSASDDCLCKVWDRRLLDSSSCKPAGVLVGHTEGLTHVSSKGDGVHCITNGKDQTLKHWDIRKMKSSYNDDASHQYDFRDFDYRQCPYPETPGRVKHPDDVSVGTFIGHSVLLTLIRCYYSPLHTTDQRFVYTGSSNGMIYIYDLRSGEMREPLARAVTSDGRTVPVHHEVVRDVSWHPWMSQLASVSWDGRIALWRRGRYHGMVELHRGGRDAPRMRK